MSKYENGFYAYMPTKEGAEGMHDLSIPQVIEIIEGEVWVTGVGGDFDIDYVKAVGEIGRVGS